VGGAGLWSKKKVIIFCCRCSRKFVTPENNFYMQQYGLRLSLRLWLR